MSADITPEALRRVLAGSFPGNLGIEPLEISSELARGRMVVDERHLHPGGFVHGGAWVAFADTIAAWGTMQRLGNPAGFTTVELSTNVFIAGVPGDHLIGEGRPLHVGRRTQVWEVRVLKQDRLAANFTCTQLVL